MENRSLMTAIQTVKNLKMPAKLAAVVFAFYMATIMAFLMSITITFYQNGLSKNLLNEALLAYKFAMPMAFIYILAVRPFVSLLVRHTVTPAN